MCWDFFTLFNDIHDLHVESREHEYSTCSNAKKEEPRCETEVSDAAPSQGFSHASLRKTSSQLYRVRALESTDLSSCFGIKLDGQPTRVGKYAD